jgi:hypothetical protein
VVGFIHVEVVVEAEDAAPTVPLPPVNPFVFAHGDIFPFSGNLRQATRQSGWRLVTCPTIVVETARRAPGEAGHSGDSIEWH